MTYEFLQMYKFLAICFNALHTTVIGFAMAVFMCCKVFSKPLLQNQCYMKSFLNSCIFLQRLSNTEIASFKSLSVIRCFPEPDTFSASLFASLVFADFRWSFEDAKKIIDWYLN